TLGGHDSPQCTTRLNRALSLRHAQWRRQVQERLARYRHKKGADHSAPQHRAQNSLALADFYISHIGVDHQVSGAISDSARRLRSSTTHLVDLDAAEVGADVAFAGSGVYLESRVRRQHDGDVALPAGDVHLSYGQLVGRVDLDIAIGRFEFEIASHLIEMNLF